MSAPSSLGASLRAIWFDVGETLINESSRVRHMGRLARCAAAHILRRCSGPSSPAAVTTGRCSSTSGPVSTWKRSARRGWTRASASTSTVTTSTPTFVTACKALKDAGYFVGVAGNQTARAGRFLRELNLPCDLLATSDEWGVTKPDTRFFDKLAAVSGHDRAEIAYVGDRLDNDIAPGRPRRARHRLGPARPLGIHPGARGPACCRAPSRGCTLAHGPKPQRARQPS